MFFTGKVIGYTCFFHLGFVFPNETTHLLIYLTMSINSLACSIENNKYWTMRTWHLFMSYFSTIILMYLLLFKSFIFMQTLSRYWTIYHSMFLFWIWFFLANKWKLNDQFVFIPKFINIHILHWKFITLHIFDVMILILIHICHF